MQLLRSLHTKDLSDKDKFGGFWGGQSSGSLKEELDLVTPLGVYRGIELSDELSILSVLMA